MANYDSLINAVKAAVKTNGTGAITGATLQATLLGTIEELTAGFQFMGVATPATSPDSNDKKEFYLGFAGTYANFGSSVTVPEGSIILFKKDNSVWSYQVVKIADPVSASQNTKTNPKATAIKIGNNDYSLKDEDVPNVVSSFVNGQLLWMEGFYNFTTGIMTDASIFHSTFRMPKIAYNFITNMEDFVNQSLFYVCFWLNNVFVGYGNNNVLKDASGTVVESIEYDEFALSIQTPIDYSNRYKLNINLDKIKNYSLANINGIANGKIQWQGGYYNIYTGIYTDSELFVCSVYQYDASMISLLFPQTFSTNENFLSLWNEGIYVGRIDNEGYKDANGNVVSSITFDMFAITLRIADYPNYNDVFKFVSLLDILAINDTINIILNGADLEWLDGKYYNLTTGVVAAAAIYSCSKIYDKVLYPLLYSTDYIGETFLSLWKDGAYVGSYRWDGKYYDTTGSEVSSIDYDKFAINVYRSQDSSYLSKYYFAPIPEHKDDTYSYYALGDSITYGAYADNKSYADYLNEKKKYGGYQKLAISGATCMKYQNAGRLSTEVASIPNNTTGLITVMIGVNDVAVENPVGTVADAMALDYSQLDDETTFANAFRYNMETIKRNSPNANLVCLIPLRCKPLGQWSNATDTNLEAYREVERGICKQLSIPYIETQEECGISLIYNWNTFMADGFHPNETGQKRIAKFLTNKFEQYCGQL